jgi:hypothetical protein
MLDLQTLSVVSHERCEERLRQAMSDQRSAERMWQAVRRLVLPIIRHEASQPSSQCAGIACQPVTSQAR